MPEEPFSQKKPTLRGAVLGAPVGAHVALDGDVAVGHGEAVLTVEPHGAGPADARHAGRVDEVAQVHRVVRDHRAEHHHAALVDELLVALADLQVVLPRQAPGIDGDDLDRTAVDAFVEGVLDGEDGGVDPVGQQLADVHVDEDADLHRLERVALGRQTAGRRVDRDLLDRLLADPAATLVPDLVAPSAPVCTVSTPETTVETARSSRAIPWSIGAGNIRSA